MLVMGILEALTAEFGERQGKNNFSLLRPAIEKC